MKNFLNEHGKRFGVSIADYNDLNSVAERYNMIYPIPGMVRPLLDDATIFTSLTDNGVSIARGPVFDVVFFENLARKGVKVDSDLLRAYLDGFVRGCNAVNYLVITEDSHDSNGNILYNGVGNSSGEFMINELYASAKQLMNKRTNTPKVCFSISDIGVGIIDKCAKLAQFGFIDAIFLNLTGRHITEGFYTSLIGFADTCMRMGVEFWITKLYVCSDGYPFDEYDKLFHIVINTQGITGVSFLGENLLRDDLIKQRVMHPHGIAVLE